MTTLIVLFNLKPGVDAAAYEQWARQTDIPTASALPSVATFEVLKASSLLGSDAAAPYQYIERIVVRDLEQLGRDVAGDAMRQVAAQFQAFADQPLFIVTDAL